MKRWIALPASAWRAVGRQPLLALVNLGGLAAVGLALWGWLYVPDSNVALVALSAVTAIALVAVLLLLASYTFLSYYRTHYPMAIEGSVPVHPKEKPLWRPAVAGLPLMAVWFVAYGLVCLVLGWISGSTLEWAKPIASWMTMVTQKPVSFYSVNQWLQYVVGFFQWVLQPMAFLAVFAGLAGYTAWGGVRERWLRHSLRLMFSPSYWAHWLLVLLVGLWLPIWLLQWAPEFETLPLATASLVARFGIALLASFLGWLFFLSGLARLLKFPKQNVIVLRRPIADPS